MPNITDWLMLFTTGIYVVVTIFIFHANNSSAKASREELAEIRRQYDEENRAYIEYEFCYERRAWYIVRFINHGKKTAYHVKIDLEDEFIDSLPEKNFREILRDQKNKEVIIGVGQHYDLYISDSSLRGNPNMKPLTGRLSYQDKNKYESEIYIDLASYASFYSSDSDEERLLREVKHINEEINSLRNTIETLCRENDIGLSTEECKNQRVKDDNIMKGEVNRANKKMNKSRRRR